MLNPPPKLAAVSANHLPIQIEEQRLKSSAPMLIPSPVDAETVWALSPELEAVGVRAGMSLYQARQTAPHALVIAPREADCHAAHSRMERALRDFSPAIETRALGRFFADGRGLESSHGDDQSIADAIHRAVMAASGLRVCVGLGHGKFVAEQAACSVAANGVRVVARGDEAQFLAGLSVDVLPGLNAETLELLHFFKLHTLGALTRESKAALVRRFPGEGMAALYELARGHDPRPLNIDIPPLRMIRSKTLDETITDRTTLANIAQRLAEQLSLGLSAKHYRAEALKLTLIGERDELWERGQSCKPPTADAARLSRLAARLLEPMPLTAPIHRLTLSVYPLRPEHLDHHQLQLMLAGLAARQAQLEDALQLLRHRFGDEVVRPGSLLEPPRPVPIEVSEDVTGLPLHLRYGGLTRDIVEIEEAWLDEHGWWAQTEVARQALSNSPLRLRRYYRVILRDGSFRHVFRDALTQAWYWDRGWLIQ